MKTWILVCLSFCLCCALSAAESPDAKVWEETIKPIKKAMRENKVNALKDLQTEDHPLSASFLLGVLADRDLSYRGEAVNLLASYKSAEVHQFLVQHLKRNTSNLKPAQIFALVNLDLVESCDVFARLAGGSNEALAIGALKALSRLSKVDPAAVPAMSGKLAARNSYSLRRAAIEALGNAECEAAFLALAAMADDKELLEEINKALKLMVGSQGGTNSAAWKQWWESHKEGFVFPSRASREAQVREAVAAAEKAAGEAKKEGYFYGLPLEGKNIIFIIDRSGSMQGGKLDEVKKKLHDLLEENFYSGRKVALLFFDNQLETYPNNGLVDGDDKSKAKLFKFLDGIQPRGGTVPEIACEHAFEKIVKRQQVDTIYLLSDGAPNNPPDQVRAKIVGLAAGTYVKIHTVGFQVAGDQAAQEFLKKIAEATDGKYVQVN
ncbi:MAG: hypothetical protein RL095_148 [Verrucomicrobiota bacterium]|jgi:Mg-chelatase subunit ChlD/HEAT repeat protein